jgi:hypothetical protein
LLPTVLVLRTYSSLKLLLVDQTDRPVGARTY